MTNSFAHELHATLNHLQFARDTPALVVDQLPIGYGGQLSRRLLALKLALVTMRKAVFLNDDDPPYVQSIERPFSSKFDKTSMAAAPHVDFPTEQDQRPIVTFEYFRVQKLLKTQDASIEAWVERELAVRYRLSSEALAQLDGQLLSWLRFLPTFESRIQRDITRLGVSRNTLGVHLRRGDKSVESPYVPASAVNDAIRRIHAHWSFDTLFLASDDPDAPSVIRAPAETKVIFDTSEKRYNNANHKMLMANPSMAAEETYVAFKNLRLLAECGGIVGQDNAHFATIAASNVLHQTSRPERVILLNGNVARQQSPFIEIRYFFQLKAREFAKRVLPRFIIRAINKVSY